MSKIKRLIEGEIYGTCPACDGGLTPVYSWNSAVSLPEPGYRCLYCGASYPSGYLPDPTPHNPVEWAKNFTPASPTHELNTLPK